MWHSSMRPFSLWNSSQKLSARMCLEPAMFCESQTDFPLAVSYRLS